jgi:dTDP-4-amino-4,6-dideoxygalactose transaminase
MSRMAHHRDTREIPVLRPLLPTAERLLPYLSRIDASRCYTNWGPLVSELEGRLAGQFRVPRHGVVSASSGTAALVGAILATAGRATSDRPFAIMPALTFVATAIAVEQCGYQVHLADVSSNDWMLDARALSSHPMLARTGVVVPVSTYGRPVNHQAWNTFRQQTGVPVVIDGAASFEALSGEATALVSELPVALSFHATKAFGSGEGGCVITTDAGVAESVTRSLNFGFFEDRECRAASTNGKMSEYHAAVGLAELDTWPAKRQNFLDVADTYRQRMQEVGLGERLVAAPAVAACYVLYRSTDAREAACVKKSLTGGHVAFRSWYGTGIHGQPHFSSVSRDALDVTDRLAPLLIGLPVAPDLAESDVARVVDAVHRGVRQSR